MVVRLRAARPPGDRHPLLHFHPDRFLGRGRAAERRDPGGNPGGGVLLRRPAAGGLRADRALGGAAAAEHPAADLRPAGRRVLRGELDGDRRRLPAVGGRVPPGRRSAIGRRGFRRRRLGSRDFPARLPATLRRRPPRPRRPPRQVDPGRPLRHRRHRLPGLGDFLHGDAGALGRTADPRLVASPHRRGGGAAVDHRRGGPPVPEGRARLAARRAGGATATGTAATAGTGAAPSLARPVDSRWADLPSRLDRLPAVDDRPGDRRPLVSRPPETGAVRGAAPGVRPLHRRLRPAADLSLARPGATGARRMSL